MQEYVGLYAPWIYRLAVLYPRVGVFPFGVTWQDATRVMRGSFAEAWQRVDDQSGIWGAGTAIGAALGSWNVARGGHWLSGSTLVIIISDGWDVGRPEQLEEALRAIRGRAGRLVWINPLMATPGFSPKTRALRVANKFADLMASGHNPAALLQLVQRWQTADSSRRTPWLARGETDAT